MIVYGVYKNADMTEGRGPIVLDKIFYTKELATRYANRQLGVMGRSPNRPHIEEVECPGCKKKLVCDYCSPDVCSGWTCKKCFPYGGDWQVKELEVIT